MHIVVCVKQVPQQNSVKINPDLSINADGIERIINLFDEYAIEEALLLNEAHGGQVTVLALGREEWQEQLRRALAMGATDAVLLSDPAFTQLDVLGAARATAAAIRKLAGEFAPTMNNDPPANSFTRIVLPESLERFGLTNSARTGVALMVGTSFFLEYFSPLSIVGYITH